MSKLHIKQLTDQHACADQVDLFRVLFGDSVGITEELCVSVADKFDFGWAAVHLLTKAARADYDRAVASARADYERITVPARADYDRARASALADYDRADYERITVPAQADYDRAWASARADYERVVAKAFAKAYNAGTKND
jgi:hypothetical protein